MKRLLRTLILFLVRLLGASGVRAAAKEARKPPSTTRRILLLRPDHLGDVLLTTPVLHALKQHTPGAQITLMVGPWSSEIVARHPDIDWLLTCPFPGFQRSPSVRVNGDTSPASTQRKGLSAAQRSASQSLAPIAEPASTRRRGRFIAPIARMGNPRGTLSGGQVGQRNGARFNPLAPYIQLFTVAQQLRRGNYELAINLRPDFWWGAALLYLAHIPRRIGYALKPGKAFLTHALPFESPEHATVSNLRLASAGLEALGYTPLEEPYVQEHYPLQFTPTEEERKWVTERLKHEGIDAGTPIIVIHPGTGAAVKLWRTEAWAACADTLIRALIWPTSEVPPQIGGRKAPLVYSRGDPCGRPGWGGDTRPAQGGDTRPATRFLVEPIAVRILLTGSANEQPMLAEIADKMSSPALIVTDTTVGQLAALLERARLVLAVDNGPAHIAVAQGTPTVQIFGPTDFRIFGPWGIPERHIVLASTQRCTTCPTIPCGRLDFSPQELPAHPCVRSITEQQLMAAVDRLIAYLKRDLDKEHSILPGET